MGEEDLQGVIDTRRISHIQSLDSTEVSLMPSLECTIADPRRRDMTFSPDVSISSVTRKSRLHLKLSRLPVSQVTSTCLSTVVERISISESESILGMLSVSTRCFP